MRTLYANGGGRAPGGFGGADRRRRRRRALQPRRSAEPERRGGRRAEASAACSAILFSRAPGRGPRRGDDLMAELTISFDDALRGIEATVRLPGAAACANCAGLGTKPGTVPRTCPTCQGLGVVSRSQGGFALSEPCRDCRGKGSIIDEPCPVCHGSGRQERVQRIRVPAGVADGQKLRVRGRGGPGDRGGPAGDLEVVVHVNPHRGLRSRGRRCRHHHGAGHLSRGHSWRRRARTHARRIRRHGPGAARYLQRTPAARAWPRRSRSPAEARAICSSPSRCRCRPSSPPAARKALEEFAAEHADDPRAHLNPLLGG